MFVCVESIVSVVDWPLPPVSEQIKSSSNHAEIELIHLQSSLHTNKSEGDGATAMGKRPTERHMERQLMHSQTQIRISVRFLAFCLTQNINAFCHRIATGCHLALG